jgi:uncharacterized membrane protein YhaH (DUF805 family)
VETRGFRLALLTFLPLLTWWLGWFPAFLSADSIDQLGQAESGDFTNGHPAFHTILVWLVTRGWDNAGAVSLVQIMTLTLVLAVVVRRLIELGVPMWPAVAAAWVVGLAPAVGPTAITIWKDVAFTIAFVWVFAELLALARMGARYWDSPGNAIRLGAGLTLLWLTRHNGFITALALLVVLAWAYRSSLRVVAPTVATVVVLVLLAQGPLYWAFSVDRERPAPGEVLLPVVAASFVHEPGNFSSGDLELLSSIAPFDVWRNRYDCDHADPLLFDPEMDIAGIRADPNPLLRLGLKTLVRDPDTSLGFFWCRAEYLVRPGQPSDAYLHRPPFAIPENDLGIARDPVWSVAYDATREVFRFANDPGRLWFTWRPALVLWATALTYAALVWRRLRPLYWPAGLLAIHLINVAATSLNHEFRLAFPLYVAGIMSLPLLWFVRFPGDLVHVPTVPDGRTLPDNDVAPVGGRQAEMEGIE